LNLAEYEKIKAKLRKTADEIEVSKRPAYTVGSSDVLANFKRVAERSGITPVQCALVYFLKHLDSITSYAQNQDIPQAEPIWERFADADNYLRLMLALLIEELDENLLITEETKDD
jgi:hypothetical protein